jgi:hypothetical protein
MQMSAFEDSSKMLKWPAKVLTKNSANIEGAHLKPEETNP